jgi:MFS family permease
MSNQDAAILVVEEDERQVAHSPTLYRYVILALSFLLHFFVNGCTQYTFGIFLSRYTDLFPTSSLATLAMIGTLQSASLCLFGLLSGSVCDHLGYRRTVFMGQMMLATGLVLAANSPSVVYLLLSQGLLCGVASSFTYFAAITLPALWFPDNKAFAVGIAASGSGIGGMVASPLLSSVMDGFGFRWCLYLLALVNSVMGIVALVLVRMPDSIVREKTSFKQYAVQLGRSLSIFGNAQFTLLFVMGLLVSLGYYVPYFLLDMYAVSVGVSAWQGALLLGVLNGCTALGRVMLGYGADKVGHLPMLIASLFVAGCACLVLWTLATSFVWLLVFSIVFGLGISGVTVASVICADLFGTDKLATTTLVGTPLATVMISATDSYLGAILFAGGMLVLGGVAAGGVLYLSKKQTAPAAV